MKKNKVLLIFTLFIMLFSTMNCKKGQSTNQSKNNKITFWHTMNPEESKTLDLIVSKYLEKNPKLQIQVEMIPFDGARLKFETAAIAGNAPDILRCEIAWTPNFAEKGYLAEITDFVNDTDDYLNAPLNYCKYNDKLYGVPQVTDCLALFYNKRLLKEAGAQPPRTMNELITVGKKLTKDDQMGFFMRGDSYWLQAFIWAFGGNIVSNDKVIQINTSQSIQGLEFVVNTLQQSGIMPVNIDLANDYGTAMNGFKEGKFAMILNGPWAAADVLSGPEFQDPSNFGVTRIPAGPAGNYGSPVGGHNYVVSAKSANVELAADFINFINNTENQVIFAINNNLLPTRYSAYENKALKSNEIISSFKYQLEVASNRPVIPEGSLIFEDFTENYQKAWTHEITAGEAMNNIALAWNEKLGLILQ